MFDAIDFYKMHKFLASKLRTIVQCTGNPYLAKSSRKMAIVVVADLFCRNKWISGQQECASTRNK